MVSKARASPRGREGQHDGSVAGPTAAAALPLAGADNEGTNEGARGDSADDEGRRGADAEDGDDDIAAATINDTDAIPPLVQQAGSNV